MSIGAIRNFNNSIFIICYLKGFGFLNILDQFRLEADAELMIQIEVFDRHYLQDEELLDCDEEKSLFDLFFLLFQKVCILIH